MNTWNKLPSKEIIEETITSLKANNIEAMLTQTKEEAKEKALSLIPLGSEVMTMTSQTLEQTGLAKEINETNKYFSVRNKLNSLDRATQSIEMQKLGAAPEYAIGSVHAVTEDGKVVIASFSGSQLPGYAYGSAHVIWVVGVQKIVKNLDDAFKRIYEYTLQKESARLMALYGINSEVAKTLIINKEARPNRSTLIFINEDIGF